MEVLLTAKRARHYTRQHLARLDTQIKSINKAIIDASNRGKFETYISDEIHESLVSELLLNGYEVTKTYDSDNNLFIHLSWKEIENEKVEH